MHSSQSTSCKQASGGGKSRLHRPIILDMEIGGGGGSVWFTGTGMCICTCVHILLLVPIHPSPLLAWILWFALKKKSPKNRNPVWCHQKNLFPELMVGQTLSHTLTKLPLGFRRTSVWVTAPVFELVAVLCLSNKDFRWICSNKGKTDQSLQK